MDNSLECNVPLLSGVKNSRVSRCADTVEVSKTRNNSIVAVTQTADRLVKGVPMDQDTTGLVNYLVMPMYFNSLVVENTNRCNARCAMCYQSAGPRGSDLHGIASLSLLEIERVIKEAAMVKTLQRRFHLSGGEAFLDVDSCVHLFGVAHDAGFLDITAVTNAYWAVKPQRAKEVVDRIRAAGVTSLELSWTFWHSEFVSSDGISNALDACYEAGIETNLRVLTSHSHPIAEALALLRPESVERATRVTAGPVFATGRAAKELDPADLYVSRGSLSDSCHSTLNLTVNALGNVFPCCAGMDQTDSFIFGNVRDRSVDAIAAEMSQSPMLRTIVFCGIGALLPILRAANINVGEDFNNICHMCWSIFSRPDCVEAIKVHFAEQNMRALNKVIALLEVQSTSDEVEPQIPS